MNEIHDITDFICMTHDAYKNKVIDAKVREGLIYAAGQMKTIEQVIELAYIMQFIDKR